MRCIFICITIFIGGVFSNSCAQDLHFSNNEAARAFSNFAAASMPEDFQATLAYRQQYTSVPVSYITSGASFIAKWKPLTSGLNLLNDKAGDASWQTTQLQIPIIRSVFQNKMLGIGVILVPGVSFNSFNADALTFNSQYTGDLFNAANASGESFSNQSFNYYHASIGFASSAKVNKNLNLQMGYSIKLNSKPSHFQVNTFSKNANRNQLFAHANYFINTSQYISLDANVSIQMKYQEQIFAAQYHHTLPSNKVVQSISIGAGYRVKDAMIFYTSIRMKDIQLNLAYDLNSSSFSRATNSNGATELILIYRFYKKQELPKPKPFCPVFL
jgi:type IX secretion system PorP/SprF family membrane protein